MKSKHFIIFLIIVLLFCGMLPLFFNLKGREYWDLAFKALSAMISLFAVCLGFYLYKRSVTADRLQQNKTDAVVALLEAISLPIILEYENISSIIRMRDPYGLVPQHYYKYIMRFPASYSRIIRGVLKAGYNIYLPKELTQYVDAIRAYQFRKVSDEGYEVKSVKVRVILETGGFEEAEYGKINEKEITFYEWLNSWNELNENCINWLKEHGGKNIDL